MEPAGSSVLTITVGSRNSQLALNQTNIIINQLKRFYDNNPDELCAFGQGYNEVRFCVISMTTTGDQILDKALPDIGSKSLFTKELEVALLEKKVDFIVHSLKDLPTTLPDGCAIGAINKRDDPEDSIVLRKSLKSDIEPLDIIFNPSSLTAKNNSKCRIGTSSQRRIAMLRYCNQNIECVNIRGNLNTRLAKLDQEDGEYAAIILAKAGLNRMSWSDRASANLTPTNDSRLKHWCYAVGQGALALECRADDNLTIQLVSPIVDLKTTYEAVAERSLMRKLEGGCSVPLGVRCRWLNPCNNLSELNLHGTILSVDGSRIVEASKQMVLDESDEKVHQTKTKSLVKTTGILLPQKFLGTQVDTNLHKCANLGIDVANEMINKGCLELMGRGIVENMDEVFKYQESITDTLVRANDKFQQVEQMTDVDRILTQAKDYHDKVINVKKSLAILRDKSVSLRKKAIKLIEEKNRDDVERQRLRERREMLEKHLEPVVDTDTK